MARLNLRQGAVQLRSRLTGDARRKLLAEVAREVIAEAERANRAAIGHDVGKTVYVDGVEGVAPESVKPFGEIYAEFAIMEAVVDYVWLTLATLSPVDQRPDADNIVYRNSHLMLINGVEAGGPPVTLQPDDEVTFVNLVAYSRRIEKGWSRKQAPDGVYEAAAVIARSKYGRVATIRFGYGAFMGEDPSVRDNRYPYIKVTPKRVRL